MILNERNPLGTENAKETETWMESASQFLLAREKSRQLRQKQKARREEENEQFRKLVHHNR